MNNNNLLLEQFTPIIASVKCQDVTEGTFRLDGQYYALFEDGIKKLNAESFTPLEECCESIYEVPPFKHIYVDHGIPFYTSSGLFDIELTPSHFLTPDMPNIDRYRIKKGQILMARSGNVEGGVLGQITIVGNILDNKTTSDHVLRFTPDTNKINTGYLAAFLMSDFCKGQLLKNAAGAVIPAIRPDALKDLQIPIVSRKLQTEIGNKTTKAVQNREDAIALLQKARSLVLRHNNLPHFNSREVEAINSSSSPTITLTNLSEFSEGFRLDAHFYNPFAKLAKSNIEDLATNYKPLSEVSRDVIIGKRFKRNYVESDHGTPFIGSKNMLQIRPSDLKYLSNTEIGFMDELMLKKGMILIACSGSFGGTFGKVSFVYNNFEDYAASQHILRIVANENQIDPGYLYAFLSSDYGYVCITRYKWGALIDEIDDEDVSKIPIPLPNEKKQNEIGDLVRQAYNLRADAIQLEDDAQNLLKKELTKE